MIVIHLHLDFETRSRCDLKKRGLDNYSKDKSTEVLMLAWAFGEQTPNLWFPAEEPIPEKLEVVLLQPGILKIAFEAEFERVIFKEILGYDIPIEQWIDPKVMGRYMSMSGGLESMGKILGLGEDKAKAVTGKKLIKLFSMPNKKDEFNDKNSHPEKWEQFCDYCRQDVIAEREIFHRLEKAYSLTGEELKGWRLDQKINDRGIPVDMKFLSGARKVVDLEKGRLLAEMAKLTKLENPNSPKQQLEYMKTQGYPYGSMGAKWVTQALQPGSGISDHGTRCLKLRQVLAKSSTAKLEALNAFTGPDFILRRQYVYYGASRTGRWSGRAVQLQNLPRGNPKVLKKFRDAVEAVRTGKVATVTRFGDPLDVVSSCLRGAFRAPKGKKFVVCDLGAIENRVLGWVASCPAILKVFEDGLDPYIAFATYLFNQPYEELDPDAPGISDYEISIRKQKRQIAKSATLGCGYQLSAGEEKENKKGDIYKSGLLGYAENMGISMTQEQAIAAVKAYRKTYVEVTAAWKSTQNAAVEAISGNNTIACKVKFQAKKPNKMLYLILPSGRRLHYFRPHLHEETAWNGEIRQKITYEGTIQGTRQWGECKTYGGKLIENLVQAIARDILLHGMLLTDAAGFEIVGSSHDEIVSLVGLDSGLGLPELRSCMVSQPAWCTDLPLAAEGYEDEIYRKG